MIDQGYTSSDKKIYEKDKVLSLKVIDANGIIYWYAKFTCVCIVYVASWK